MDQPIVVAGTLGGGEQPEVDVDADLILRPFRAADAPAVIEAFSTADIQHWHQRRCDTVAEATTWIDGTHAAWRAETSPSWAITDRSDDVLGRVGLHLRLGEGHAEIGYWLLPAGRGRGIASRAAIAITAWAHEVGVHRIELQHSTRNVPSRRVAQRAGFVEEGIRRSALRHADGWHDMCLWSHLATDA